MHAFCASSSENRRALGWRSREQGESAEEENTCAEEWDRFHVGRPTVPRFAVPKAGAVPAKRSRLARLVSSRPTAVGEPIILARETRDRRPGSAPRLECWSRRLAAADLSARGGDPEDGAKNESSRRWDTAASTRDECATQRLFFRVKENRPANPPRPLPDPRGKRRAS